MKLVVNLLSLTKVSGRTLQINMETIGELHKEAGVDKTHLRGHREIKKWRCSNCSFWTANVEMTNPETTLGTWGPNGNGWNYWCPKCNGRLNPLIEK